jgi:membrane-associated phospholipid phosphatase
VLGDGWIQAGAAVGVYAAGELSHDERTTALGADLVRGQVLNGVLTQGLKVLVGRPRPGGGHHSSFPSGHTSAAFANAAILQQHLGWKVGVAAYGTAGFIGWTRVRDHDHYLSDVLAGTAIGIVAGQTVSRPHGRGSWIVTPSASPTQVAVYISRRP